MGRIFRAYEQHAAEWDDEFRRVRNQFADRMRCGRGCSMCCSQMFSISPLEAAVIAEGVAAMPEADRERLAGAAHAYVADAARLGLLEGDGTGESVTPRTGVRLPCPALRDEACSIYELRPLICRKWGIPVHDPARPDRLHACELNFQSGEEVDGRAIVQRQASLLERWVALKEDAREALPLEDRTFTVAEAILAGLAR